MICFVCQQNTPDYVLRAVMPAATWERMWAKVESEPDTQVETVCLCRRCQLRVGSVYRNESESGIVMVIKERGA